MGKVITSLQFVTQSAPSTPPSTHGNIFASASTLYFKNSDGVEYDLASSSGSLRISYYTGSATTQSYTYNKLGNLKYL
jgi:predicted Zn-dependent protease